MTEGILKVTCAIIIKDGHVLCCQRPSHKSMSLKWEFPGGKIEEGESEEESVKREIKEELNINIKILKRLISSQTKLEKLTIELIPFICEIESGELINREHPNFLWLKKNELGKLDWAKPDIPVVYSIADSSGKINNQNIY